MSGSRRTVLIAVAGHDIQPGQQVTSADLRRVAVPADSPLLNALAGADTVGLPGLIAAHRITAGAPIAKGDLLGAAGGIGRRSMSVPVPIERANGGDLSPGDRIDVIDTSGGQPSYVANDLEVLTVVDSNTGGLTDRAAFSVSVSVDADQALAVAGALAGGKVDLVRSTGAREAKPVHHNQPSPTTTAGRPAGGARP
jgi:Flp pilus assembly protein CpaB